MKFTRLTLALLALGASPALALACPGGNQGPPPEATAACSGAAQNQACEFETPHGNVSGTCQDIQGQVACVPAGGRRPGGPGGGQGGPQGPSAPGGQVPQGA
ncbi:MAG: hypothetical protein IT572_10680 [Deltaproteobacteria bacterium]|nr:hypothetical protein [Deltaproteobacteria bacterium]